MRNVDKLPRIKSQPFPHVVVKNFLDPPTLDLAIDALAGLEYDFKESDLFSYWASIDLTDINHPAINILRDDLGGEIWRKKVAESFKVKPFESPEDVTVTVIRSSLPPDAETGASTLTCT